MHMAKFPPGIIGYIEIPITSVKPFHYKYFDLYTLVNSVNQAYQPLITESIIVHSQDFRQINKFFELNHFDP